MPMPADQMTLLRSVLNAPLPDAPREAYADWLSGAGHAGQAEFIRVSLKLAKCRTFPGCVAPKRACDCAGCAMKQRIRELLTADAAAAWADLDGLAADGLTAPVEWVTAAAGVTAGRVGLQWSRGFVGVVHAPAAAFWPAAAGLFRRHPVTRVRITDAADCLRTEARETGERHYWLASPGTQVWVASSQSPGAPPEADAGPFAAWLADRISDRCVSRGLRAAGLRA